MRSIEAVTAIARARVARDRFIKLCGSETLQFVDRMQAQIGAGRRPESCRVLSTPVADEAFGEVDDALWGLREVHDEKGIAALIWHQCARGVMGAFNAHLLSRGWRVEPVFDGRVVTPPADVSDAALEALMN